MFAASRMRRIPHSFCKPSASRKGSRGCILHGMGHCLAGLTGLSRVALVSAIALLAACRTLPEVKASLVVLSDPQMLSHCDYVGTFKMHFASDGAPLSMAAYSEQVASNLGFRKVVAAGANAIYRVDKAPAPLVTVDAYRCPLSELARKRQPATS